MVFLRSGRVLNFYTICQRFLNMIDRKLLLIGCSLSAFKTPKIQYFINISKKWLFPLSEVKFVQVLGSGTVRNFANKLQLECLT